MEKGLPPVGIPVPVQFEAIAYIPVKEKVVITPSWDALVSPVNVPVVESKVSWLTAAVAGVLIVLWGVAALLERRVDDRGIRQQQHRLDLVLARLDVDDEPQQRPPVVGLGEALAGHHASDGVLGWLVHEAPEDAGLAEVDQRVQQRRGANAMRGCCWKPVNRWSGRR